MPLLSSCSDLLGRVAGVAQDASKGTHADDRSQYVLEMRDDENVGDVGFEFPNQFTHLVIGALVYAAGERLATLSWCVAADPIPHIFSASELARAAAESSARASWLGTPDIQGSERLSRLLGMLAESVTHEDGLARELDLDSFTSATHEFLEWGARNGVARTKVPTATELLRDTSSSGRVDYRRLSASAHSTLFAVVGTWIEVVEAQEGSNFDSIVGHSWAVALSACSYVLEACERRRSLHGRSIGDIARLRDEIADWYQRVYPAADETDWPGTVPPTR